MSRPRLAGVRHRELGGGHALPRGLFEPLERALGIELASLSFAQHHGHVVLRQRMAELGGLLVPGEAARDVERNPVAGAIHHRELELRGRVIGMRGFLEPAGRDFGFVLVPHLAQMKRSQEVLGFRKTRLRRLGVPPQRLGRIDRAAELAGPGVAEELGRHRMPGLRDRFEDAPASDHIGRTGVILKVEHGERDAGLDVAATGRFFEPLRRALGILRNAVAGRIKPAELDLRGDQAARRGLFEPRHRLALVAVNAGSVEMEDRRVIGRGFVALLGGLQEPARRLFHVRADPGSGGVEAPGKERRLNVAEVGRLLIPVARPRADPAARHRHGRRIPPAPASAGR